MLNNIISTVKETHQEKLDDTFEELRREYEWYCVTQSEEQKKRHAANIEALSYRFANIAQVLYLLE